MTRMTIGSIRPNGGTAVERTKREHLTNAIYHLFLHFGHKVHRSGDDLVIYADTDQPDVLAFREMEETKMFLTWGHVEDLLPEIEELYRIKTK